MEEYNFGTQLGHAYLVSSPAKQVREALSQKLAAALVCSGDGPPCGRCRDCRKAADGVHPDIITIERQTDERGNKKREIYVEQVRAVSADAWVLPNEARRKVYIILDADTMNQSAQNAALKLLEEPPRHAAFILCAANCAALLPTVRSRCTELTRNGESETPDEEILARVDGFFKALEGSPGALFAWCCKNEDMDPAAFRAFSDCARRRAIEHLCAPSAALPRETLMGLVATLERCAAFAGANTGVKHMLGYLAATARPSRKG